MFLFVSSADLQNLVRMVVLFITFPNGRVSSSVVMIGLLHLISAPPPLLRTNFFSYP